MTGGRRRALGPSLPRPRRRNGYRPRLRLCVCATRRAPAAHPIYADDACSAQAAAADRHAVDQQVLCSRPAAEELVHRVSFLRALRVLQRRPASGSTLHDRDRHPPCLASPLSFTSGRASDQTSAVLTTSADPLQAPRSRHALVCLRSKKLAAFAPTDNTGRLRPPQRYVRSVRDLQIPIGPARPNRTPSSPRFPPYEAFERRPRRAPIVLQCWGRRPKPFSKPDIRQRPAYLWSATDLCGFLCVAHSSRLMRRGSTPRVSMVRNGPMRLSLRRSLVKIDASRRRLPGPTPVVEGDTGWREAVSTRLDLLGRKNYFLCVNHFPGLDGASRLSHIRAWIAAARGASGHPSETTLPD